MTKTPNQKLKLLYLLDMLMVNTDDQHGLTMADIITNLAEKGIKAERKSIYDDLDALRQYGVDVISRREKVVEYAIGQRDWEYSELTLLADAVQSSRFLTQKKSEQLILKLRKLISKPLSKRLKQQIHVPGRIKMHNESVYYNIDSISDVLNTGSKISFQYFSYDFSKTKVLRRNGDAYTTTPLGLIYIEDNYYLVTYNENYDKFVSYRVDRMLNIVVLSERAVSNQKTNDFDISDYSRKTFKMFGGEDQLVELIIKKSLVNGIIDRFGKDVLLYPIDNDTARICVNIKASGSFFGWLAQFGSSIKIDKPKKLADEYCEFLKNTLNHYKK